MDRHKVAGHLEKKYDEAPVAMGIDNVGNVVEIFASPKGSWTMVVTYPSGLSCLAGAGRHWEILPVPVKGEAM